MNVIQKSGFIYYNIVIRAISIAYSHWEQTEDDLGWFYLKIIYKE